MVTGGASGVGALTAQGLARLGALVVIVGRRPDRGAEVRDKIKQETGNPSVDYFIADLSQREQVGKLAEEFKHRYKRLDVLINNIEAVFDVRTLSKDGIEMTLALNHLSYFLVSNLLLDRLKGSAPARIINVSSELHKNTEINFADLQFKAGYDPLLAYKQSKLANLLFTYELARRLDGTGVTVNALHPGFVATTFGANNPALSRLVMRVSKMMDTHPERGADTSLVLASSPEVQTITGKYFTNQKLAVSSPASYDRDAARRLWEISIELTGLKETVEADH